LKTFLEKWKLLFRNVGISIIFEDFFREFEAFSRIVRLFKCILVGCGFFRYVSVAFKKLLPRRQYGSSPDI
jgi:hypothetical protein